MWVRSQKLILTIYVSEMFSEMNQWIRWPAENQQHSNSKQPQLTAHTKPLYMLLIHFLFYFGCMYRLHVKNAATTFFRKQWIWAQDFFRSVVYSVTAKQGSCSSNKGTFVHSLAESSEGINEVVHLSLPRRHSSSKPTVQLAFLSCGSKSKIWSRFHAATWQLWDAADPSLSPSRSAQDPLREGHNPAALLGP